MIKISEDNRMSLETYQFNVQFDGRIFWWQILSEKNRFTEDDYELTMNVLTKEAQSEGITEEKKIKWK